MLDQFLFWTAFSSQLAGLPLAIAQTPIATFVEISKGAGRVVADGDIVVVHVVASTMDGREIANSERRGLPIKFKMGDPLTPSYLDYSVRGMSSGGYREVVLPPKLAFGTKGALPFVAPNTTLMLRIRMVKIESPPPPR